ncbi:hypothetical protein [Paenibacillus sp. FSL E2-0178]|uniref:hypothetical protein n=1 Tax=Paenibacillus sp. FSL E2-0178 TaxID=2921361 RepID=UPI003158B745
MIAGIDNLMDIKPLIIRMLNEVNIPTNSEDIKIIDRGIPHKSTFKEGNMYIYTFHYNNQFLKIGKVGGKSRARFYSHHYNPSHTGSNLAKSILNDHLMKQYNLTEATVGEWIKKNVARVDFEVNSQLGIFALNLIESILHCLFPPKYEGFDNQRL